jgi:hypothetical protein
LLPINILLPIRNYLIYGQLCIDNNFIESPYKLFCTIIILYKYLLKSKHLSFGILILQIVNTYYFVNLHNPKKIYNTHKYLMLIIIKMAILYFIILQNHKNLY